MEFNRKKLMESTWRKQEAQEAAERRESYLVPVAAGQCFIDDMPDLTDDEIRLVGWYMGDGNINQSNGTLTISQSEAKYADEVRRLLFACGFGFREYRNKKNVHGTVYQTVINFVVPRGTPRGDQAGKSGWERLSPWLDKDIPTCFDRLSRRQFGIFIAGFHRANGRRYDIKTLTIACGCRQRLADRIQGLAVVRGFRCGISAVDPAPSTWNPHPQRQWLVRLRVLSTAMVGGTREEASPLGAVRNRLQPVPYKRNEWVWCMTTPLGTLVIYIEATGATGAENFQVRVIDEDSSFDPDDVLHLLNTTITRPAGCFTGALIGPVTPSLVGTLTNPAPGGTVRGPSGTSGETTAEIGYEIGGSNSNSPTVSVTAASAP